MTDHITRRTFVMAGATAGAAAVAGSAWAADSRLDGGIDAHVHVWTPDTARYPLKPGFRKEKMNPPSFTPEQLLEHCRPCGVSRIVLIQMSFYGTDNSYMLDAMRGRPGVFSGVARIDGDSHPRQSMLALAKQGVRGFRIGPMNLSADQWLAGAETAQMWKCAAEGRLAICPLMPPSHLPSLARMCGKFPETPVVIDHMARIGFDGQVRQSEVDDLCRLAEHKQVHVKVSAFYALGRRKAPYLDLAPMIRRLRDAFGPDRLMWGSDSPFQVAAPHAYSDSIELVRTRLDFLSAADRQSMLRKTAERLFF